MIPASERAKTVHALDRSATVTGKNYITKEKYKNNSYEAIFGNNIVKKLLLLLLLPPPPPPPPPLIIIIIMVINHCIATGYGLDGRRVGIRIPVRENFSPLHVTQTDSEAHTVSYPMGTGGDFPRNKAAGA
jgi:hypothetical protein